jgi:hypothetical protein
MPLPTLRDTNRYGLTRDIPAGVKRVIRQHTGFGCAVCGVAIGQYEHIDPTFNDAREHDPERMTYLCATCHDHVTRGIWSKAKVWEARSQPFAKRHGHCHSAFDVPAADFNVWLCNLRATGVRTILAVDETPLLIVEPPEVAGGPFQLSARFYDEAGRLQLEIERNEWFGHTTAWDIECVGPRIFIRSAPRAIMLQICAVAPHGLAIERINMRYGPVHIVGTMREISVHFASRERPSLIRGRGRALGLDPGSRFLRISDGHISIGGSGSIQVGPDLEPPPFRRPFSADSPCVCGSGKAYRRCCGV